MVSLEVRFRVMGVSTIIISEVEVVKNEILSEFESMMLVSWKNSRFPGQLDK